MRKLVFAFALAFAAVFSGTCAVLATGDGVYYEVFVRSFYDSDGDGIGDFKGLTMKLDYLNDGNPATDTDLGIKGIWLMPVLESPSYHGYDVTDYYKIEKEYGTEQDFDAFIAAAHKRGIKVIMDLVLNHTSSENKWFVDPMKRDWYVWRNTVPAEWTKPWGGGRPEEVWHKKNGAYYYGAFGGHMPELNYQNPDVVKQMEDVIKFWLDRGVDGFRLDAVRYLVETGGGPARQADTPETHDILKTLSKYARSINKDCFIVGEVWAGNDTGAKYYGGGEELGHVFNFDLASAIINSVKSNNYSEIENVMNRAAGYPVPTDFYCPFLANHDQNRIASEFKGDIPRMKLATSILLSMKGIPFMYYGEEVGMAGSGPHESIRTPMQWDVSANAGFTKGKPWERMQDYYSGQNVAAQAKNRGSLLNHYKTLISVRNSRSEFFTHERIYIKNNVAKVYSYMYTDGSSGLLFAHNFDGALSREITLYMEESGMKGGKCALVNLISGKIQNVPLPHLQIDPLAPYETRIYQIDILKGEK
ncbi:MAG: alpha-amylase family glycosyl hydrolase [Elusimicrobiota bacterium]